MERQTLVNTFDFILRHNSNNVPNDREKKELKERILHLKAHLIEGGTSIQPEGFTSLQYLINDILQIQNQSNNKEYYTVPLALFLYFQGQCLPATNQVYICYLEFVQKFFKSNKTNNLFVSNESAYISHLLVSLSLQLQNSILVLSTLKNATQSQRSSDVCLTPAHADMLEVCVASQMFSYAIKTISKENILEIDPKQTSITTSDYCRYFYYSGLCYFATKDYASAMDNFIQVIIIPSTAISTIVENAIKKAKLISLLESGTSFEVPKYASSIIVKFAKDELVIYDQISKNFIDNDMKALSTSIELLKEDENYGIAKQVLNHLTKHRMKDLTNTYITLSLTDIANQIGLPDSNAVENILFQMISFNEINASIDKNNDMVRFGSCSINDVDEQDESILQTIEKSMSETVDLSNVLRNMQHRIITSREYISKMTSSSKNIGGTGGGGHDEYDDNFEM